MLFESEFSPVPNDAFHSTVRMTDLIHMFCEQIQALHSPPNLTVELYTKKRCLDLVLRRIYIAQSGLSRRATYPSKVSNSRNALAANCQPRLS